MIIYKITNLKNGKVYIGQTTQTLKARMSRHITRALNETHYNYALCNAIRKYKPDSFKFEIIENVNDKSELNEREMYWIKYYNSTTPSGYNMTEGGGGTNGYKHKEEDKAIMSSMKRGMYKKDENPFYGKHHSEEQKAKWRKERSGRTLTDDHKLNISKTRKRIKIINIDTNEVFESARHVCRHYGKDPDSGTASVIAKVCRKEKKYKTVLGYRFEYYKPEVHDNTVPSLKHIKEGVTTIRDTE